MQDVSKRNVFLAEFIDGWRTIFIRRKCRAHVQGIRSIQNRLQYGQLANFACAKTRTPKRMVVVVEIIKLYLVQTGPFLATTGYVTPQSVCYENKNNPLPIMDWMCETCGEHRLFAHPRGN